MQPINVPFLQCVTHIMIFRKRPDIEVGIGVGVEGGAGVGGGVREGEGVGADIGEGVGTG